MTTNDRRLIVDHSFDCTVETVIDAFLREGFTVTPVGGGDLRQHSAVGGALRYAVLEATLSELAFAVSRWRADVRPCSAARLRCTSWSANAPW